MQQLTRTIRVVGFLSRLLDRKKNERKRLAAELHGNLGQNLLIIKNRAEWPYSDTNSSAMAEQSRQFRKYARSAG